MFFRFFYVFLLTLALSLNVNAQERAKTYKLMIFGDSLSVGHRLPKEDSFPSQLQKVLEQKGYTQVEVINNSKSGETTAGGLKRQKKALTQHPNGVLLELGINDVFRGVSVDKITKNLSDLIENFQKDKVSVLLAGMKAPPVTEPTYAAQFFEMYASLAQKYHLVYYPFFMQGIFEAAGNQIPQTAPYMLADKIHPNATGVDLTVQHILPSVQTFLNQQGIYPQSAK